MSRINDISAVLSYLLKNQTSRTGVVPVAKDVIKDILNILSSNETLYGRLERKDEEIEAANDVKMIAQGKLHKYIEENVNLERTILGLEDEIDEVVDNLASQEDEIADLKEENVNLTISLNVKKIIMTPAIGSGK